ncbi:MAG: aspartate 1-decarboxylase [Anaerolineales bacterium]
MYRKLLKSKIHRAVVTGTELEHEGSITIDKSLLKQAGIKEFEYVQVVNLENGARFETYTLVGEPDSGIIELNGPAARLCHQGDRIIIMSHILVSEPLPENWNPKISLVNDQNQVREK